MNLELTVANADPYVGGAIAVLLIAVFAGNAVWDWADYKRGDEEQS